MTLAEKAKVYRQFTPKLPFKQWLESIATWFDCEQFFQQFTEKVFTIATANTYGLDTWGIRLGLTRYVTLADGSTASLDNNRYRQALITKALAHVTDCTIPQLNFILRSNLVTSQGSAFYQPYGVFKAHIVLYGNISAIDTALILATMPKPQGVLLDVLAIPSASFGFSEAWPSDAIKPWDTAPFYEPNLPPNL